jgi:phage terminase large subunit
MASADIVIPYSPRRQFLPLHLRSTRWACVVAHRRAGKTVACVNELIKGALTCPHKDPRFAYIAPYFVQAKDVAWTYLKRFSAAVPGTEANESELRIDFPNGARIRLYGADNYDRLRGGYLDGVVLDEYADMDPRAWSEVIRPMLADRQGWAIFIGTPKGRNAFFDIFEHAKTDANWTPLMLRASETALVAQAELDDARALMTPEQYEQEFECSFEAAIMGAYYGRDIAQAERDGRITSVPYEPDAKTYTAWDLGMGDSTAIWCWQAVGSEIRVIDYIEDHGKPLGHYVSWLNARGYQYAEDMVPHDAKVRELGTGKSRIETLLELGRKPQVVPDHKREDGINAVRLTLPRVWFDAERCKHGIEALRQYRSDFDEKTRAFKNTPRHDWTSHAADAFRYMAIAYRELKPKPVEKPKQTELIYHVNDAGQLVSNMSVREIIELRQRRKERE